MNILFAKLYEQYLRRKTDAKFNILLYISFLYFFLTVGILLPVFTFLVKKGIPNKVHLEKSTVMISVLGIFAAILFMVYLKYIRNDYVSRLYKKHKSRKISKFLLYALIIFLPVTFLLLGAAISVFLNGGEIGGSKITGLFE